MADAAVAEVTIGVEKTKLEDTATYKEKTKLEDTAIYTSDCRGSDECGDGTYKVPFKTVLQVEGLSSTLCLLCSYLRHYQWDQILQSFWILSKLNIMEVSGRIFKSQNRGEWFSGGGGALHGITQLLGQVVKLAAKNPIFC